jgi:hypothetical protein
MKVCSKCDRAMPPSEFYADKRATDGKRSCCKYCSIADAKRWRGENLDKKRRTDAAWQAANPARARQNRRNYSARHSEAITEKARRFRRDRPVEAKAHNLVGRAVRNGRLVRPSTCDDCGAPGWIEAHHDDYSRPLYVRWLCKPCHATADRIRAALTPSPDAPSATTTNGE